MYGRQERHINRGDEKFFQELDEQLEGAAPGLSQRLERLNFEQLGRAIVVKKDDRAGDVAKAERIVASVQGKSVSDFEEIAQRRNKEFLAGYILPVQADQAKHVIILKNGSILVIRSPVPGEAIFSEKHHYLDRFSPNAYALELSHDWKDVNSIESEYLPQYSKVVLSSKNPRDLPQIAEAISQSLGLARELKASRDKAKQDGLKILTEHLDSFFGTNKPNILPPGQIPPPADSSLGSPSPGPTF